MQELLRSARRGKKDMYPPPHLLSGFFLLLLTLFLLASCAPPVQSGEDGNVRIDLSGGSRAVSQENQAKLAYTLEFSGPGGESRSIEIPPGRGNITLFLTPGNWTVQAKAYLDGILVGNGGTGFPVHSGRNNSVTITMSTLPGGEFMTDPGDADDFGGFALTPEELNVSNNNNDENDTGSWVHALKTIKEGGNDKNYIINLSATFAVDGSSSSAPNFGEHVTGITVSLRGVGTNITLSLDPSSSGSLLSVKDDQTLILRDLTLKGHSGNNASLVYVVGSSLYMKAGAKITENVVGGGFGGSSVHVNNGSFIMEDGLISGNSATSGGGVRIEGSEGSFTMKGGEISGNSATNGGGVYVSGGSFTMEGGIISGNPITGGYGGGVYVYGGSFTMKTGATISGHTVTNGSGGGVYVRNSSFTMEGGTISGNIVNYTSGVGGGVSVSSDGVSSSSSFTMKGGVISGNTANNGGGVSVSSSGASSSSFIMEGGEISGNILSIIAGGVFVSGSNSSFIMKTGATISGNKAEIGGGVSVQGGTVTMQGGVISGNTATNSSGGGVYVNTGDFTLKSGEISGNSANSGAGVFVGGSFTMEGGKISGNSGGSGAGVFVGNSSSFRFTMQGGEISGNSASSGGGVYVVDNGSFTKTGNSVIYGDNDGIPGNGTATDNTATSGNSSGHAVGYTVGSGPSTYYYRDATLYAGQNINTGSALPGSSGVSLNNWTMR